MRLVPTRPARLPALTRPRTSAFSAVPPCRSLAALAWVSATVSACAPTLSVPVSPTPAARPAARPPAAQAVPDGWRERCNSKAPPLRPLLVEWPAPDRAALEAQAKHGQLVVRYVGCDFTLLRECKSPRSYGFTATTPKEERVRMTNADELFASVPLYAAKLEGKLAQAGELNAELRIVGEHAAPGPALAVDQLSGDCATATHVVSALSVGAFAFYAGSTSAAGASASVLGFGAGGEHKQSESNLSRDGDGARCAAAKTGDAAPPAGCGALLRLELTPLLPAGEGTPLSCPRGTRLNGKSCVPLEKASALATADADFVDPDRGFGWSQRCAGHYRAGALHFARAACRKGLEATPPDDVRAALLYNLALVEEQGGDPDEACELLSQAQVLREQRGERGALKVLKARIDALECGRRASGGVPAAPKP